MWSTTDLPPGWDFYSLLFSNRGFAAFSAHQHEIFLTDLKETPTGRLGMAGFEPLVRLELENRNHELRSLTEESDLISCLIYTEKKNQNQTSLHQHLP